MFSLVCALALIIGISGSGARRELASLFDAHLQQSAAIMLLWTQTEPRAGEHLDEARFRAELQRLLPLMQGVYLQREKNALAADDRRELAYAIICESHGQSTSDACLSVASPNAPTLLRQSGQPGFSEHWQETNGAKTLWHVYTLNDAARQFTVRVAERDDIRRQLITNIVRRQSGITLVFTPLVGILVWWVVGHGLRPLQRLSQQIRARRADLLEPVATAAPKEVSALVAALNQLFYKATAAFDRERRFSADVAHELRTPLSVIKTTAELAASRSLQDGSAVAYAEIIRQCARASRVLDQLLQLSRMEGDDAALRHQSVDLAVLARDVMADLAPVADEQAVELVLEISGKVCRLNAEPVSLSILLRNLMDNAIRHSPPGAEVCVAIQHEDGRVSLSVSDRGAGMSRQQRGKLQGFLDAGDTPPRRGQRQTDESGHGLGLLIVQRIARLHGTRIDILPTAPDAGLCVRVVFANLSRSANTP
ncbi:ATP-binding protein [Chromatocurvus halotolerans]|nr:ATP-binding protein [Chromatocurvus halotolerans]